MDKILLWERRMRRMEGKRMRSGGRRGEGEREGWGQGDATTPIGGGGGETVGISNERPDESTTAQRDDGEAGVSPSSSGVSRPVEEEDNGVGDGDGDGDGDSDGDGDGDGNGNGMATGECVPKLIFIFTLL